MENSRLGRRIRAFRKLKGYTQEEFAKRVNMSTTTLGRMERGTRIPTEEQLEEMATVLQITTTEFKG